MKIMLLHKIFFALLFFVSAVSAQNFNKVIEIVGGMEESLKKMIASEELNRKKEDAALKADIAVLKTVLFRKSDSLSTEKTMQYASAETKSIIERLQILESHTQSAQQTGEITELAGQLSQLIGELKNVVNEGKQQQQKQLMPLTLYSITGQIRHRGEIDGRNFVPNSKALWFNLLRSRVNVSINPTEEVKIFLQLQDSRVFGNGNSALLRGTQDGMSKSIDFHQAYFAFDKIFSSMLSVKIGRMELSYGKQRLVSVANWNNVGIAFDAGLLQWKESDFVIDVFSSKLAGTQTSTVSENFRGVYSVLKYFAPLTADVFLLYDDNTAGVLKGVDAGKPKLQRYTSGVYVYGKNVPFDYDAELIFQNGSIGVTDTSARASLKAFLYSGVIGYTINFANKLRTALLYTVFSGDENVKSGAYTAYNKLFEGTHAFYGMMDFFPKVTPDNGLRDAAILGGMEILPNLAAAAEFHYFMLHKGMLINASSTAKEYQLGYEFDLTATHKYNSFVSINGGIGAFLPDKVMISLKGPAVTYWGYVMTTINF